MQCAEVTSCFCSSKKRGKQAKLNKQLQNVLFFFKKKEPKDMSALLFKLTWNTEIILSFCLVLLYKKKERTKESQTGSGSHCPAERGGSLKTSLLRALQHPSGLTCHSVCACAHACVCV